MQVNQIMTSMVELIDPNTSIRDAARKMRDENIGALPVGENDRLVGMVTDRDIATRGLTGKRGNGTARVRDVMSEKIYYCFDDQDVEEVAQAMAEHQVRRMPVLNRDKRMVGFVSVADLSLTASEAAKKAMEGISEPSSESRH